ncbi:unnamed protein product (macronuclear) [Paramecium tetraurelia]|uniref:CRC domain-containing protein n=1 Tax=Paramecium tetraurelia TaxID=5888 RepID=A0DQP1_PARTE|nr:uncharacterized protein GSPATT00002758001 [Paramecium tetraurelia]CAK85358.1 unnamed protein product [Paramecium tetraurelia]|eukprot:XP_001452755.1 hypothetical protein (macronuclear) [Paramecium tetraurelia strain d4-2]
MSSDFKQDGTPFTKLFQRLENIHQSPVFNADCLQHQDDMYIKDQSPEQVCKKLEFTPYLKSPNQFQPYSPLNHQTTKKANIFVISPARQINFDHTKTEQRLVNISSPLSSMKIPDDLLCEEEEILSEDQDNRSQFRSPPKSPHRKLERATKLKFINFVTLKKPLKFTSDQITNRKQNPKQSKNLKQSYAIVRNPNVLNYIVIALLQAQHVAKIAIAVLVIITMIIQKKEKLLSNKSWKGIHRHFRPKVESKSNSEDEQDHKPRHFKGCNCKKSNCLKKYCECYQMGVKCSELCKCDECKNCEMPVKKDSRKRIKHVHQHFKHTEIY